MNIPVGRRTAEKHARYKRASGPLLGTFCLESSKYQGDSWNCTCKHTGIMILGKSL